MHRPSSQQMEMKMIDGLPSVGTGIDHQSKTVVEMFKLRDFVGGEQ